MPAVALSLWAAASPAAIRIEEICANPSTRLLQRHSSGVLQVGTGVPWQHPAFDASAWEQAPGPFGFGTSYTTDLSTNMQGAVLSLYLRRTFTASSAIAGGANSIQMTVDFDSGIVAWLNGREVLRKNMGAPGSFVYHDQAAFNARAAGSNLVFTLGIASNLLVSGANVLAIQVHNDTLASSTFAAAPALNAVGASTTALVRVTDSWRYFTGAYEPSGGIPASGALPTASIGGREWCLPGFDAAEWPTGPGGFGYGDNDDATDVSNQMRGVSASLYIRREFVVSAATRAQTNALEWIANYDDGYVAYLNGTEIARANLGAPGSYVPNSMLATASREANAFVTNRLAAAQSLLLEGTNVLAVQAHNVSLTSSDLSILPNLRVSGAADWLVRHGDTWSYWIGTESPVPPPDEEEPSEGIDFADWIELVNDGPSLVSLANWSLTDDPKSPGQWRFPDTAFIPAGGRLVVLCTGADVRDPAAATWDTSFRLSQDGEYLGLYDAGGALVHELADGYPAQTAFHTYGWSASAGGWRYFSTATPGTANTGATFLARCEKPDFLTDAGFHTNNIVVTLACDTPGATIRYTIDGTEPTESTGFLYAGGIPLSTAASVRTRAFLAGWVPSPVVTRSFLVNQPALLRQTPAVMITGDPTESVFKSNGITSIVGGKWVSSLWKANGMDDWNIPMFRGRPYERPAHVEFVYPASNSVYKTDMGLRIAGSAHARPRYTLQALSNTWYGGYTEKPQLNIFFRQDYGKEPFEFPFATPDKRAYESLRIRSGKNDQNNPFIRDELCRRLAGDTGQVSSRGIMAGLYVNGLFRCYYNPAERYDTGYFQMRYGGTNEWDIVNHGGLASGDGVAWGSMLARAGSLNLATLTNYQALCDLVDPENLVDYLLVNVYAAMWDWPHNNYYAARERSPAGRFRFYVWDAEGGFGMSGRTVSYDSITKDLIGKQTNAPSAYLFDKMRASPEFRLLFADRIHRHLFNGGALTRTNIDTHALRLKDELNPLMRHVRGTDVNISYFTNWTPVRPSYLMTNFTAYGLWPLTGPPLMTPRGGTATNGTAVTLWHTNAASEIYYAFDGADPRAPGGAVAGTRYTGPITLDRSRHIRARCRNGTEWSAVTEATFRCDPPRLVVSEIFYNPPGTNQTEFIEVFNADTNELDLSSFAFTRGISFRFADGGAPLLAPGEYAVVVQDPAAFAAAYPTNGMKIAGVYSGSLANNGENLALSHDYFGEVQSFAYNDTWYGQTDGDGFSLTIRDPFGDALKWTIKTGWRASTPLGGTPGAADPGGLPDPGAVVVNEMLTHTDASPVGDWIELFNTTTNPIPIGGWFLSDSEDNPYRYQIPAGTVLPALGFLTFNSSNHFARSGTTNDFGFSEYGEEEAVVSSGLDAKGNPTGYRETEYFDAAEREVVFGRHLRSDGEKDFVAMRSPTPGAPNTYPRVGPLVFSEILYAPATNAYEFVELRNITDTPVPLYDPAAPANAWRLANGVDFTFPAGQSVAAYGTVVVCSTSPAVFRAFHGLSADVPVYGPFAGALNNAGESVRLEMPLPVDGTNRPYALVERVDYKPSPPWPVPPAGASIERAGGALYGNDPLHWRAGSVGGTPGHCPPGEDSDGDGIPDAWEFAHDYDPANPGDGAADRDGDDGDALCEYIAGTDPANSNDFFALAWSSPAGDRVVQFMGRAASGDGYEHVDRRYTLEYLDRLPGTNWLPLGSYTNLPASNGLYRLPAGLTNDILFLRGRVWLEER